MPSCFCIDVSFMSQTLIYGATHLVIMSATYDSFVSNPTLQFYNVEMMPI